MSQQEKENEADVLSPDDVVQIGGKALRIVQVPVKKMTVQVREFTFGQSMKLEPIVKPLITEISSAAQRADELTWSVIAGAMGRWPDQMMLLLSESTGLSEDDMNGMSDRDGRLVMIAFVKVNWDFFLDRLVIEQGTKMKKAATTPAS